MNIAQIIVRNAFAEKKKRNWDRLYWAIDLHHTVITGTYNRFNDGATIYPYAKEVLDFLYEHPEHKTILWSSSYDDALHDITTRFDLKFNYINTNPEVPSNELCNFNNKLYFNILLEDKAGFDGNRGWGDIKNELIEQGIWNEKISIF